MEVEKPDWDLRSYGHEKNTIYRARQEVKQEENPSGREKGFRSARLQVWFAISAVRGGRGSNHHKGKRGGCLLYILSVRRRENNPILSTCPLFSYADEKKKGKQRLRRERERRNSFTPLPARFRYRRPMDQVRVSILRILLRRGKNNLRLNLCPLRERAEEELFPRSAGKKST